MPPESRGPRPRTHGIGQPELSPGRGGRGNLSPRGRVSERQTGHRLTNSGWRSSTCRRCLRGLTPWLPPPAVRAAGMTRAWRRRAGARWWSLPAPGSPGAAAHPPLPLEAHYNPPRAAGIRDLSGRSQLRSLRALLSGLGRVRTPRVAWSGGWGESWCELLQAASPVLPAKGDPFSKPIENDAFSAK